MRGYKSLTKEDLISMIETEFENVSSNTIIATLFFRSDMHNENMQQCLLFEKIIDVDR